MRKCLVLVNVFLILVVFALPIFAQQRAKQIVYCRLGSPVVLKKWLNDCETKIWQVQARGDNDLFQKGKLSCQFSLDESGNPANLNIVKSSGSKEMDELAISIVKKAAPFNPIPAKSLVDREILVQFRPDQQPSINLYPRPSKQPLKQSPSKDKIQDFKSSRIP